MDIAEFLTARIARDEERARIADWDDPVRLTAECVAKRRIMDIHSCGGPSQAYTRNGDYGDIDAACDRCGTIGEYGVQWPCATLLSVAAVYASHPDYDPAWQPTPKWADLRGIAPDFTGGQDTRQFVEDSHGEA